MSIVFEVADATVLDGYDGRFDTTVSSQLIHCLNPEQRRAHVAALTRVLEPGGRLIQFSADFAAGVETFGLHSISEDELRTTFTTPDRSIVGLRAGHAEGIKPRMQLLNQFAQYNFQPEFTDDRDLGSLIERRVDRARPCGGWTGNGKSSPGWCRQCPAMTGLMRRDCSRGRPTVPSTESRPRAVWTAAMLPMRSGP